MNQRRNYIYRDPWHCQSCWWPWWLHMTVNWPPNHCSRRDSSLNFRMLKNYSSMNHSSNFGLNFSIGNWWRRRWTSCCSHMNWAVELMAARMAGWHLPFRHGRYRIPRLCSNCTAEWFASVASFEMYLGLPQSTAHSQHCRVAARYDCLWLAMVRWPQFLCRIQLEKQLLTYLIMRMKQKNRYIIWLQTRVLVISLWLLLMM